MKVLQGIFLILLTVVLSVTALLTASAFKWAEELPPISEAEGLEFTATSQIFAANGEPIGEILPYIGEDRALTNRVNVSLDEVSPAVIWAVVASEDDQFFSHFGFDIPGIAKATYLEFLGDGGRGGSTISTQVIKNTLLSNISAERSLERKAKEIMLATELERRLTKSEILQQYLNLVYWGGNLYGVHAAAKAYFDKDPVELNLAEGLYLARLIPTPSANYNDFTATRQAMRVVLDNMVAQGVVSQEIAEQTWRYPLAPTGWDVQYDEAGNMVGEPQRNGEQPRIARSVSSDLNPYVAFAVRNEISQRLGQNRLFGSGGLKIYTTIDVQMQESANQTASDPDGNLPPEAELAIVSVEPSTGHIMAMVGGTPQDSASGGDTFNRATDARRQPGSSFKPIIVATALEQGNFTQASVISDERTVFKQRGRPDWAPQNHDETFVGVKTLRQHLDISRNIPIAKLVEAVTPEEVVSRATELGYENLKPYPSIALGAFEVTPLQHVSAISTFANGGVHVEPHLITKVTDAEDNVLYEAEPREAQVWSEETAYIMLDMLHGNVMDSGAFSARAQIDGRWVGGKTGTTNSDRDIWFVGTTPEITTAVWIGYDDNRSLSKNMPDGERLGSSRQPVRLWQSFTEAALAGRPAGSFTPPGSIVFKTIDLASGAPSSGGVRAAFVNGNEPGAQRQRVGDPISITIPIDNRTETRADENTPREFITWQEILPSEIDQYTRPAPTSSDDLSQTQ